MQVPIRHIIVSMQVILKMLSMKSRNIGTRVISPQGRLHGVSWVTLLPKRSLLSRPSASIYLQTSPIVSIIDRMEVPVRCLLSIIIFAVRLVHSTMEAISACFWILPISNTFPFFASKNMILTVCCRQTTLSSGQTRSGYLQCMSSCVGDNAHIWHVYMIYPPPTARSFTCEHSFNTDHCPPMRMREQSMVYFTIPTRKPPRSLDCS